MKTSVTSDSWCTPKWLADLLGHFDIDPCSNTSSHIRTGFRLTAKDGDDGLTHTWLGSVFVNPPYSNPLPWCERLRDHAGPWCALLKLDPTTRWWSTLMAASPTVAPFRKRIKFEGDRAMTANFPSVLIYSAWRPSRELAEHLWIPQYANVRAA